MRRVDLVAVGLMVLACSPANPSATDRSASSARSPDSSNPAALSCKPASSYGLLISSETLQIVSTCGAVLAKTPVKPPTVQFCGAPTPGPAGPTGAPALLQPPVSATTDKVYFRDGDNKIRFLTIDGHTGDATTVPGGSNLVSFFSVSPDNVRISVVVVDLTNVLSAEQRLAAGQISADTIKLRLYVEDLQGGGHHNEIYSTTWTNMQGLNTLWPMGWHSGQLVLALMRACSYEQVSWPQEWHVADAATADRTATIGRGNCISSMWPSPAGVACVDFTKPEAATFDWTGRHTATVPTENFGIESALSPNGSLLSLSNGGGLGDPAPVTRISRLAGGDAVTVVGHKACLWIDDANWLSRDAVVAFPSGAVRPLPAAGQCAGRLPGGL